LINTRNFALAWFQCKEYGRKIDGEIEHALLGMIGASAWHRTTLLHMVSAIPAKVHDDQMWMRLSSWRDVVGGR
jgi:hypothetical protein